MRNLVEKKILMHYMERYGRDVYKVAKELGCDRTTIQRKLRKYGISSNA